MTRYPLRFRLRCLADPRDDGLRAREFWLAVRRNKARDWLTKQQSQRGNVTDIRTAKK